MNTKREAPSRVMAQLAMTAIILTGLVISGCTTPTPEVQEVTRIVVEQGTPEVIKEVVTAEPKELTRVVFVQAHAQGIAGEDGPMYAVPKHFGWFEEEGLDVVWEFSSGSSAAIQLLLAGNADIINSNAEPIFTTRNEGNPVVAFMAVKGRSGYAIGVLPDSPIQSLEDCEGKIIGVSSLGSGAVPIISGELGKLGLEQDVDYTLVAAGSGAQGATALTSGQVDALGLWDATYAVIENQGVEMRYIDLPILDNLAPFSMVATEDFIAENPEVVRGFARAVVKGFRWSLENPEAMVELFYYYFPSMKAIGIPAEEAVKQEVHVFEMWMANAAKFQDPVWGYQYPEKWEFSQKHYVEQGLLDQERDPTQYYSNDLVEAYNDFDLDALLQHAREYVVDVDW
jgi:NitT/TauT family transport system substrate-binding protein